MIRLLTMLALLWFAAVGSTADLAGPPRVVGHRGLMQTHPENTLAGFQAGWQAGVAVELDVRRTKDGYLIVLHDDTLERTTTGSGKVADMTRDEVRKLDAGQKFNASFSGQKIPDLSEVFALLKKQPLQGIAIAVDLKIDDGQVEADVVKLAKEADVLDRLLFIGTTIIKAEVRERLRASDAKTHNACLAADPEQLAAAIADKNSDWVYLRFVPTAEQMKTIREAKKKVFLSGPLFQKKEIDNWKKAQQVGADAVLTDYPVELQQMLQNLGK